MGTLRALLKAGPDIEKALDPVLVFILGGLHASDLWSSLPCENVFHSSYIYLFSWLNKHFFFFFLVFIRGTTNLNLNLWSVDILNISAKQESQPDMQVGCPIWFGKLLYIF